MNVEWNSEVCCHSGNCVKTLPEVFVVESSGLAIRVENASEQAVREVVAKCPAGALIISED